MIIWGSVARDKQVATAIFFCPACHATSACSHRRVSRYFTLYFIPLFATRTLGEYVRCLRCAGRFETVLLTMSREQIEALVRPWPCAACGNHNPAAETRCAGCGAPKGYAPHVAPADDSRFRSPPPAEYPA